MFIISVQCCQPSSLLNTTFYTIIIIIIIVFTYFLTSYSSDFLACANFVIGPWAVKFCT
jgi:hypothetical protein